jgi:transcriptional regulator with XRE-family HTH domain
MATDEVLRGPTGETVRQNVARLRAKRGLSLRALAAKTEESNRPLGHGSINQIEQGRRRVDVDDLMVLSVALGVSPLAILFPQSPKGKRDNKARIEVEATGIGTTRLGVLWSWGKCLFIPSWAQQQTAEWEDRDEDGVGVTRDEDGQWIIPYEVADMMSSIMKMDQQRMSKLFELFDLFVDDYQKDRQAKKGSDGDD